MSLGLLALLLASTAQAVDVYVNGVLVNGLEDQVLQDVTVTFDANGDVRIDAPNVKIGRSSDPVVSDASESLPEVTGDPGDVPAGRWWLVAQDTGSRGVEVDVRVNGELVRVIASGEPQVVADLATHLHRGPNQITLIARSSGRTSGGGLTVYVGTGSTQTGVLELGQPVVSFTPSTEEVREGVTRVFAITVD